jgi:2-polyprenyl-6-methoxyphenol hydroxylase-like FAD-dependent oxidoreductase
MTEGVFDVIIVGYGPVSQALALMLGHQGRKVAICERWSERYPLPRAVCVDHELYRVLSANGMQAMLPAVTQRGPLYQWFNADWKELLVIDWSQDAISGGPEVNFVHQPTLEEAMDKAVAALPSVTLHLGYEAVSVEQDAISATVQLRSPETKEEKSLSAQYIVGCDGANSLVRATIGGEREDKGFEADWLVIDVLLKKGVTIEQLGIPPAGQYCNPVRPTTIVPAGVREGRVYRRWEFMRLPGETNEELEDEARVWELLKPWAGPDDIELVRHKVYNFRSLMASKWRDRRIMIAGDAAHVMPPFMGQGMCAGMRDAWNLAWRLGLILDYKSDDKLLDGYQPERQPHVDQIVDMSIFLGKIICVPDAVHAAERDEAFFSGNVPPMPDFPQLTDGLLHRDPSGKLSAGAGLLSPHVAISRAGATGRFDDLVGRGFALVCAGRHPDDLLEATTRHALEQLGINVVLLEQPAAPQNAVDLDGRLTRFMHDHHWQAMIVRPDYYIYGGAATADVLPALVADFLSDLRSAGVKLDETLVELEPTK